MWKSVKNWLIGDRYKSADTEREVATIDEEVVTEEEEISPPTQQIVDAINADTLDYIDICDIVRGWSVEQMRECSPDVNNTPGGFKITKTLSEEYETHLKLEHRSGAFIYVAKRGCTVVERGNWMVYRTKWRYSSAGFNNAESELLFDAAERGLLQKDYWEYAIMTYTPIANRLKLEKEFCGEEQ